MSLASNAQASTVLVLGDSLSAAYGLKPEDGWVALLSRQMATQEPKTTIVNASISGETTAGGLSRLPTLLAKHRPTVVVLALGANDGLRGLPIATMKKNLSEMTQLSQRAKAKVLICAMQMPPNYGELYTKSFYNTFGQVARQHGAALQPFLLEGIAQRPELFQADQLHPTAQAQEQILKNVWPHLKPLL